MGLFKEGGGEMLLTDNLLPGGYRNREDLNYEMVRVRAYANASSRATFASK